MRITMNLTSVLCLLLAAVCAGVLGGEEFQPHQTSIEYALAFLALALMCFLLGRTK